VNLVLPVLLLIAATMAFPRIAVMAWDTFWDLWTQPFHPREMAAWAAALFVEITILVALSAIIVISVLTIAANWG
jgi:uncharacterized membrane protein